mgnify:CR=1 FL=1
MRGEENQEVKERAGGQSHLMCEPQMRLTASLFLSFYRFRTVDAVGTILINPSG